jgi:hypothetical protein
MPLPALIEKTTTILRTLLEQRDTEARAAELQRIDDVALAPSVLDAAEAAVAPPSAPEPPLCPYCHQAPCVGPTHDAFDVLHWNDPVEVKKRDEYKTREMLESLRRERRGYR